MRKSIVSKNTRIRYLEHFNIGDNSIIDDFCYISTRLTIGNYCHIAANCTIGGGVEFECIFNNFSFLGPGARVYTKMEDYTNCLIGPFFTSETRNNYLLKGNIVFDLYSGSGANCLISPNNYFPEGVIIGTNSFVPSNYKFKEWGVYAGIPIKFIKYRNKELILKQV